MGLGMNFLGKLVIIGSILLSASCATSYQQEGFFGGGFSEIPLSESSYQISVKGNGYTSSTRVNEMALLRAAELANDAGFKYFVIGDISDSSSSFAYTTPSRANTTASVYDYGNSAQVYAQTNVTGGQTFNIVKPGVDLIVHFLTEEQAQMYQHLSVQSVFDRYAEKYGLEVG